MLAVWVLAPPRSPIIHIYGSSIESIYNRASARDRNCAERQPTSWLRGRRAQGQLHTTNYTLLSYSQSTPSQLPVGLQSPRRNAALKELLPRRVAP